MEFRLIYEGPLRSGNSKDNKKNIQNKHHIRRCFHKQLKILWEQPPLNQYKQWWGKKTPDNEISLLKEVGDFEFIPLVSSEINFIAHLNITLLRPDTPNWIIKNSGDIDNRLKTLFDALRTPENKDEVPPDASPQVDERPFFCLLEDDYLITAVTVATDRLLKEPESDDHVLLIISVETKSTFLTLDTIGL